MIRKELSIEDIRDLEDNSQVYIVYLDGTEFDLEYCSTVPINTYSDYRFIDNYGDEFSIEEIIDYINNGSIKVCSTENTQFKTERKLTNYERIKNMTIEEMAESRVFYNLSTGNYENDLILEEYKNKSDAIKREIDWLNKECE